MSTATVSCKKGDFSDFSDKPAYIKIEDISVTSNELTHGAGTDQISDAWIFVDDQQIGVFELPCEVPVLLTGDRNIKVFGGIKRNGIGINRAQYEFYAPYSLDTNLKEEETYSLKPVLTYTSEAVVSWKENFEDVSTLIDSTTNSTVPIIRSNDKSIARSGLYYGAVNLTAENNSAQLFTVDKLTIPRFVESYMEIDYKSNLDLKIFITAYLITGSIETAEIITVRPTDTQEGNGWRKMYVHLATVLESIPDATSYQFFFEAKLPSTLQSGYVYLDNIKIVQ